MEWEAYINICRGGGHPVGVAGHYMGGESTKLDYIRGALPPPSPHYGKPWALISSARFPELLVKFSPYVWSIGSTRTLHTWLSNWAVMLQSLLWCSVVTNYLFYRLNCCKSDLEPQLHTNGSCYKGYQYLILMRSQNSCFVHVIVFVYWQRRHPCWCSILLVNVI